ncbi:MAG: pirin family protein [Halobacteriovoraceae bacterium]|nr:pirin family protein [Halobacteriovoraceae bacterium]
MHKHWVGDGFHVYNLLRPSEELNKFISPFILIDYASPEIFPKTDIPKGVGEHPHRGFETVTFAYQGEIEHRDSSGGGGIIKPGDVQWMTAGKGVVHDEFHSVEFSKRGGIFEMVQLWVNLPKKDKLTKPKYQGIKSKDIPVIKINNSTNLRVIAGEYEGTKGPSSTFTPINIFDISSSAKENLHLELDENTNTVLLILSGELDINNTKYMDQSAVIFEREGNDLNFTTSSNFKALLLNGEPIDEPMVAHGPFVMNTELEIVEAITDYQNGVMGKL